MALYDNKLWIMSHIHNSFMSSDDTGMCEQIMGADNFKEDLEIIAKNQNLPSFLGVLRDEEDEVDGFRQRSPDIKPSGDHWGRNRSYTAVQLDKQRAQDRAPKVKVVQWRECGDTEVSKSDNEDTAAELFPRKNLLEEHSENVPPPSSRSLLSRQLDDLPEAEANHWMEYGKFDAGGRGGGVRPVSIYCTMAATAGDKHVEPLRLCCAREARVSDVVGLVCLRYTAINMGPKLIPGVENYSLYMCEDNGDVDADFPPLEPGELFSKYGFSTLALVENSQEIPVSCLTLHLPDGTFSQIEIEKKDITLAEVMDRALEKRRRQFKTGRVQLNYHMEAVDSPGIVLDPTTQLSVAGGTEFYIVRDNSKRVSGPRVKNEELSFLEAPLFQSFNVSIITKVRTKVDIHLGISGEKVEIDPVQQTSSARFWSKQKAVNYEMDNVVSCEVVERRPRGDVFKMVYLTEGGWRTHEFEGEGATVAAVVEKVNHLLDMRQSEARKMRKEYLENKEKKKYRTRTVTK